MRANLQRVKTNAAILCLCLLAACGSRTSIGNAERSVFSSSARGLAVQNYYDYPNVQALLAGAGAVGENYIGLSDQVATQQDVAALTLLLTAAKGAYEAATGASASQLTRVGLFGLTINSGANYLNPAQTSSALLRAAKRQMCVVSAGRTNSLPSYSNGTQEFGFVADALTTVRLNLRLELTRGDFPNYAQLADQYAQSLARVDPKPESFARDRGEMAKELKLALDRCLIIT